MRRTGALAAATAVDVTQNIDVYAAVDPRPYHANMGIRQRSSNGRAVRPADTVAQDWRAWDLRCQHLTYREIGEELGIDPSTAFDAVQRAAQMIRTEGAVEMKQAMLDETDRMSRHLWGIVERQQSGAGPGLHAISQLLRVQERKARLMGLDAPTKRAVDVITHDAFMEALGDLEADVAHMEGELERGV
jgi:hypothetical protein